ncbi:MAG TPA: non-canonical purine NTP pyrophosphatase [Terriglobia bacterium]|nr:non-canonical purine NTP pyrophosphatase [Terriglobia bacterium]
MARSPENSIQLWLASTNACKLREFSEAARARGISVKSLPAMDRLPPCVEDGLTFDENARKKAVYYSRGFEGVVFADDSGLCVDAFGGAPGVFSARYAGPEASDDANNAKLIAELRRARGAAPVEESTQSPSYAHYDCVIALARAGRVLAVTDGRAPGVVIEHPRGSGGFGYDPHFYYPPLGQTFAELSPEVKFAVSHRGEAFRKLLDGIEDLALGGLRPRGAQSPVLF